MIMRWIAFVLMVWDGLLGAVAAWNCLLCMEGGELGFMAIWAVVLGVTVLFMCWLMSFVSGGAA